MYKVFIVDDEPFIIEGLYDIVDWSALDMEIVGQAGNGQEALEALQNVRADVLITDISMPLMNGLDLIHAIRDSQPEIKVIILSGYDEFGYLKEGMALGIENYLLKPINLEEFRATLNTTREKLDVSRNEYKLNAHSISILRDNVMHRWLHGQIGPQEFRERAELLGIVMDKPLVQAALLRPEADHAELFRLCTQALDGNPSVIAFQDMDGDIVLLHLLSEYQRGKEAVEQLHAQLLLSLSAGRPLHLSVGTVEEAEGGAAVSYRHAKRAQEYFMLFPELELLRYEELQRRHEAAVAEGMPIQWEEDLKLIMARDKETLLERIAAHFEQLRQMEGITPDLLQGFAMEWLIRFRMKLKEIRHVEEPELFADGFGRIRTTASIGELTRIIQEAAAVTVDALIRDVKSPVVQQVLNYIHESYFEDVSLKTLGVQYNIHPVYLGQLFHKEVNESFTDYINKYRIEKAKEQLRSSGLKVHEIARNVGYWETGYFYKQFKKHVGISPTEYKGLV
ncbi:response regulator transcription factor [Paenibacillus albidus]|uniref:response regulator transcription factor n=1 Tax=Paenibacillus albidus TaxID=2041023 RepID=UPI001BE7BC64|nr:response regulator transcription factor [Paenibacillus albidus]MBT2289631.1 response regulator transcription factor [Paenibacillus albidus]